jgi:hypothetical protein
MRMNECSQGDFLQWIQIQQLQRLFPAARRVSEFLLLEFNYFGHNFFYEPPIPVLKEMFTINNPQLLDDYFSKF